MASKEKLIRMAVEATGDEEIIVAGDFEPKGMMWKRSAGAAAGSLAGGAVSGGNSWAQAAGATGGLALGSLASGASTHLPANNKEKLTIIYSNNRKSAASSKGDRAHS